ncbi:MBL fold metallo-hydrolase [Pseudovibrio exalbescens]|uniref:MBL fold metallo-hydrolase n=1 Tax=Pseudovibrio exalbescens TaxID=197461 RepID=A0A1U7JD70_9HYPH|nr:MBL fold metallo-hydrolase [Pseudovibrio exalbescens]OKL42591.1 MBL fold metallo-hydrolase [Pseudovibrio exalbescens]
MAQLRFNRDFDPRYGSAVTVAPKIQRITCQNPSPLTFHGTNTFLIGEEEVAVLDPGPEDNRHLATIMDAIGDRKVSAILISHTHIDHSPLSRRLQAETQAPIYGCAPHSRAEAFRDMPENPMEASADHAYEPDQELLDSDQLEIDGLLIEVVATPGHTINHLSFALPEQGLLFPADHVMAWSTSVVAPPDGSMGHYMASIDRLLERAEGHYFPAHGGELRDAHRYLEGLKAHRQSRETAVIGRLRAGDTHIPQMVANIYADVDKKLHGAAALNVLAHLEDLSSRGVVATSGPVSLEASYRLTA